MLLDNPATSLLPLFPCTLSCPASVSGSRLSSSVSARAFNNTLFYLAALFTFLMKLFSTIYNCHEQSTGSTCLACPALAGTGLALPWLDRRRRRRCVYLNAPRGEFCAQQIYVYELYDMYAAPPPPLYTICRACSSPACPGLTRILPQDFYLQAGWPWPPPGFGF